MVSGQAGPGPSGKNSGRINKFGPRKMTTMNNSLTQTKSSPRLLFAVCLMIALGAADLCAAEGSGNSGKGVQTDKGPSLVGFRLDGDQDVTEAFATLLESGKLKAGEELVLDHKYRISGSHTLPDNFTLSAVKGAGFDVTDAAEPKSNRPLLELGDGNTLRNLTITYLNTPDWARPAKSTE